MLRLQRARQLHHFVPDFAQRIVELVGQLQLVVDGAALDKSLLLSQASSHFGAGCVFEHRQHEVLHNFRGELGRYLV